MSNSLDPDQARQFVGPDLGPNCLPRLTADDNGRQRVKDYMNMEESKSCSNKVFQYIIIVIIYLFLNKNQTKKDNSLIKMLHRLDYTTDFLLVLLR